MPTPDALPLRWFIFRPSEGGSASGSFSRTEAEAREDVNQRIHRSLRGTTRDLEIKPRLTRDSEAEARANAALLGHAKTTT